MRYPVLSKSKISSFLGVPCEFPYLESVCGGNFWGRLLSISRRDERPSPFMAVVESNVARPQA